MTIFVLFNTFLLDSFTNNNITGTIAAIVQNNPNRCGVFQSPSFGSILHYHTFTVSRTAVQEKVWCNSSPWHSGLRGWSFQNQRDSISLKEGKELYEYLLKEWCCCRPVVNDNVE